MSSLAALQATFTNHLPTLEKMAKISFRHLPPEAKEESISNAIGLCWKFIYNLFLKGRAREKGMLASCMRFAIKQTREGRTPQGCPRAKDAFDLRRFGKVTFEDFDLNDYLGRSTPIADQVSFKLDVPKFFRECLSVRDRKLAKDLARGLSTSEAAKKYKVSDGRISQFRREFMEKFNAFFTEPE
jgi:hypothetical protein